MRPAAASAAARLRLPAAGTAAARWAPPPRRAAPPLLLPSLAWRGAATATPKKVDVAVVGAGFSGIYMAHRAKGMGFSVQCIEAGSDVGGTWYWNRYPGAKCDFPSMEYCYSWCPEVNQEWNWKNVYGNHAEIQAYIRHVASKYDILKDIQFNTTVSGATFDDTSARWVVATDDGMQLSAKYLVTAVGGLSQRFLPNIPGRDEFAGRLLHTHGWPKDGVDFTGRRVAIVGVGSSAAQVIPCVAKEAAHLYVFMRTPNFVLPAHDGPAVLPYQRLVKRHYAEFMRRSRLETDFGVDIDGDPRPAAEIPPDEFQASLERRYAEGGLMLLGACSDAIVNMESNQLLTDFLRKKIREAVKDPAVAEAFCPYSVFGQKRPVVADGFYETFNRENVTLVPLKGSSIEAIAPDGIVALGEKTVVDDIILATGFDSMTGAYSAIDITGRNGLKLKDAWAKGPQTYLGLGSAGFPNLLTITGPQSPSILSNVISSIEQHVDWVSDCLHWMRENGKERIEPAEVAVKEWVDHVNMVADMTVYKKGNDASYRGSNIPGKPDAILAYPGGLRAYRAKCAEVAEKGYEGFDVR